MFSEELARIARKHRIHPSRITGPYPDRKSFMARADLCLALYLRGNSYPRIGRWLNRHHTTIINAVRRAKIEGMEHD